MITLHNVNAIKVWAHSNDVTFWDVEMPYVLKDGMYYYFGFDGKGYTLLMTSFKDLGVQA